METYIAKKEDDKLFLFRGEQRIGQISPDATWVKDGDEFDEEQIAWMSDDGEDYKHSIVEMKADYQKNGDEFIYPKGIYAIKGSCGHFH